jgi:ethanolamine utilization microcompartment shell protein EutL
MQVKHWFYLMTALAFTSFILLINVDSAYADEHNMNNTFRNLGIVAGLLSAIVLAIAYQSQKK